LEYIKSRVQLDNMKYVIERKRSRFIDRLICDKRFFIYSELTCGMSFVAFIYIQKMSILVPQKDLIVPYCECLFLTFLKFLKFKRAVRVTHQPSAKNANSSCEVM